MTTRLEETKKDNVVHGVFSKEGESDIQKCYREGRRAELALLFKEAASNYLAAHNLSKKKGESAAIFYKWYSMRCMEYEEIYKRLLRKIPAGHRCGIKLNDGSIMASWTWADSVLPKEIVKAYTEKVPKAFYYNVVIWNHNTKMMRFVKTVDYYTSLEPAIPCEYRVDEKGVAYKVAFSEDKVLLHKWLLSPPPTSSIQDYYTQVRRSIRIEFLKVPDFMCMSEFPTKEHWETYVAPAIGNRNVGPLAKKFADFLVGSINKPKTTLDTPIPNVKEIPDYYQDHCYD